MSGAVSLEPPIHRWYCPSCDFRDVTREVQPHSRFHACRGMKGLTLPMIPEGTRAEHRRNEREDYVGTEDVVKDGEGRPAMSVQTIREDGEDCTVFVPTAHAKAEIR